MAKPIHLFEETCSFCGQTERFEGSRTTDTPHGWAVINDKPYCPACADQQVEPPQTALLGDDLMPWPDGVRKLNPVEAICRFPRAISVHPKNHVVQVLWDRETGRIASDVPWAEDFLEFVGTLKHDPFGAVYVDKR